MAEEYRRKAPRRDYDGQVGTLFHGKLTITQCAQLGEGGALIHSKPELENIEKGDQIVLTLFLLNIGGLIAPAQCVYRAPDGKIGLQFLSLDTVYKKHIREFVSRRKTFEVV